jgi:hypothetical protein
VVGALVTLGSTASTGKRTTVTNETGSFHFAAVAPGNYTIAIVADGFAPWTAASVVVREGENPPVTSAVLQVASASTKLDVGLSPKELAVEQLKTEEKQRLLGVFPNYFVTYDPNAAPLNAAQKFQLGWKTILDPTTILSSAIAAGIEQARNSYHEFGQGMEGYGKRFGAQYADAVNGVIIGGVIMQTVFHQDPRYFYKGTGSFRSRALYAIATAFVRKGDNGRWQPDYSDVLGSLAAGEISTLYYPASSRTGLRLFHRRKTRAGKVTIAHTNSSAPPTAMPTMRKGNSSSQISGYKISATSASGQQKNSTTHHTRNVSTALHRAECGFRVLHILEQRDDFADPGHLQDFADRALASARNSCPPRLASDLWSSTTKAKPVESMYGTALKSTNRLGDSDFLQGIPRGHKFGVGAGYEPALEAQDANAVTNLRFQPHTHSGNFLLYLVVH